MPADVACKPRRDAYCFASMQRRVWRSIVVGLALKHTHLVRTDSFIDAGRDARRCSLKPLTCVTRATGEAQRSDGCRDRASAHDELPGAGAVRVFVWARCGVSSVGCLMGHCALPVFGTLVRPGTA